MSGIQKILLIVGAAFTAIGGVFTVTFWRVSVWMTDDFRAFLMIPVLFLILGLAMILWVLVKRYQRFFIIKHGTKYPAKIYSYVENTAYTVNGRFPVNVKVHYFDRNHIEREAIIPTNFEQGTGDYPVGMTIDIYEYRGKYDFDPASVRDEILPGEGELMDDKPVDPSKVRLVAVSCQGCGASFQAAAGYAGRCPYCGRYKNVQ